jgi:hypothetical protein
MAQLKLFSDEVNLIVQNVKPEAEDFSIQRFTNPTKMLKGNKVVKERKPRVEKVENMSVSNLKWGLKKFEAEINEFYKLYPKREKKELLLNVVIDKDFIMREDLRDYIFQEDEKGRYRERIQDEIKKFGYYNWFREKGYVISPESIWKNRYSGHEIKLEQEIPVLTDFEIRAYYLWENWLPKEMWNTDNFMDTNEISDLKEKVKEYSRYIRLARTPFEKDLNKWKEFIIGLVKEREGEEIDKIWFNESSPYEYEVEVRLKGHRCWNSCVSLRFDKGHLKAYDSNFGGGTSFIGGIGGGVGSEEKIKESIIEIMEKVFKKECSNSGWNDKLNNELNNNHREIDIDEFGWIKN